MPTELPSRFTDEQFDAFEARHQVLGVTPDERIWPPQTSMSCG
jgi:hypothetical protein